MANTAPERIAIVGLGLMGGSLARALKARPAPPWISACDTSPEALDLARSCGAVDRTSSLSTDAVSNCQLIIYALPFHTLLDTLERDRGAWGRDAVITDVAGLKGPVVERAQALGVGERYVGSHPMAGDHRSGFGASRGDLYAGARVWLVAGGAAGEAAARVEWLWREVGGRPAWIGAEDHDELVAWASHGPQLVANALAAALAGGGIGAGELGPGGRDMTRLAASEARLWVELLGANASRVVEALAAVERELAGLRAALERGDLEEVRERMERTRAWRASAWE